MLYQSVLGKLAVAFGDQSLHAKKVHAQMNFERKVVLTQ